MSVGQESVDAARARRFHLPHTSLESAFGNDWFGRHAEDFARFFGTPTFLIAQTVIVAVWIWVISALLTVAVPLANAQGISDFLATLKPTTDAQKAALATANQYASMVEQSRLLMSLQIAAGPVSWFLIAILIFWTASLFFGIGLYAESNALVIAALTFGALSIAFAMSLAIVGAPAIEIERKQC